jgi:hypothetical protein
MPPKQGPRPLVVGNGDDVAAEAPSGFIQSAIGSFDSVTNVTSVTSAIGSGTTQVANAYTLQLNTNFFSSSVCTGADDPAVCRGWQQFVFENNGTSGRAFIQYWIIRYNNTCPAGGSWNQFSFTGSTDIYCWKNNSGGTVAVPNQPITNLGSLSLTGAVSATGDSVTVFDGTTIYARAGDNAVDAAAGWNVAEFNVFGDGGSSAGGNEATFNNGADIVVRTRVNYGDRLAPNCVAQGFTAETNNLSFSSTPPAASQPGPAVIFREDSAGGATANCAAAVTVGDTHLMTFNGLFYDFQSSGDYLLADTGTGFVVQARQVSGAPTWPDTSVNNAVATRMGDTRVAMCLPNQLNVDGENVTLADGQSFSTLDGVDIWRSGNVYTIMSELGDSVRATLNGTHINVSVGLGRWPSDVRGLLANADNNVNLVAARDGKVLARPFQFADLYGHYGDSWRVPPGESLLTPCGEKTESGKPARPFFAHDLERTVHDQARAVCVAAGVKGATLLDACTLDVAVIGNDEAAKVFVDLHQPVAEARPEFDDEGDDGQDSMADWCWWLILLVIVLLLLLIFRKRPTS